MKSYKRQTKSSKTFQRLRLIFLLMGRVYEAIASIPAATGCNCTAVLRYLLCKKNEPELSLHFLVTSYDGQGHVYKRKIIRGADLEKTYI